MMIASILMKAPSESIIWCLKPRISLIIVLEPITIEPWLLDILILRSGVIVMAIVIVELSSLLI